MRGSRNAPIGSIEVHPYILAYRIRARIYIADAPVSVWLEGIDVYAQSQSTAAARRIEDDHPLLLIGIYKKGTELAQLEDDINAMRKECGK